MRTLASTLLLILLAPAVGVGSTDDPPPRAASPGAADRVLAVEGRCPTFVWEVVPDTLFTQLVAYRLAGDDVAGADLESRVETEREVLYTEVPGGIGGWTPSADRCLAPGSRYVWFVRAVYALDGDEIADAGSWSEGLYFAIPDAPSVVDVRRALAVLERYVETGGDPATLAAPSAGDPASRAGSGTAGVATPSPKSVRTASAAIRGEHPATSGEAYGLIGSSASPDGAGVAASNTAGGADLVLDGAADGVADARLSQSGLDVPSASAQTFTVGNSAGGGFTLDVAGEVSATSFAGDGSALTGIQATDADTLDGHHGAHYTDASNLATGTLATGRYSAYADLGAEGHLGDAAGDIARNNGALQPTLNADLLDGLQASAFTDASNLATGTLATGRYSAYADLDAEGYLDMSAATDLVTRLDGDDRFLNATGDRVRGDLTVQNDGARLVSLATPADVAAGDVIKLEVQDPAGASLFSVDSTGIVSALSYAGDGGRLTGITADDLDCPGCVDATDLATDSVGSSEIATGAVRSTEIAANAVNTDEIVDGAITSAKIADSTITAADIARDTIGASQIGPNAVRASEIAADAVGNDEIADGAVTNFKIAAGTITGGRLANSAVNSVKILDESITAADLAPDSVGASEIGTGAVGSDEIDDFSITAFDVGMNAVTAFGLAADAVNSSKIANGTVTTNDIADGTVTTNDIADGTVTTDDVADGTLTAADVDPTGGIYAGKSAVYVTGSLVTVCGRCSETITVSCRDENDLPLQVACDSAETPQGGSQFEIRGTELSNWTTDDRPAEGTCYYFNLASSAWYATPKIACISVPGP